jgi:hypothetical protein
MSYPKMSARDALHVAIMEAQDIDQILSLMQALTASRELHVCLEPLGHAARCFSLGTVRPPSA